MFGLKDDWSCYRKTFSIKNDIYKTFCDAQLRKPL